MNRIARVATVATLAWMFASAANAAVADANNFSGCDNNGGTTCTISLTLTAGRGVLILAGHTSGGSSLLSCTDGSNTYTVIPTEWSGNSYAQISGCYTCSVTAGGSRTITLTFNQNTFGGAEAREITGQATSGCLGTNGSTNAQYDPGTSSDAVMAATLTTTQSNEYVYCISQEASFAGTAPSTGTGWSTGSAVGVFIHFPAQTEYQVKSIAGSTTGTFTANGASDDFLTKCASFRSADSATCTHTATSVSSEAIQAAIEASGHGDTVCIPGGTGLLTTELNLGNKQIVLKGVGPGTDSQCAVENQSVYTCLTMGATNTNGMIEWEPTSTGSYRLTGITFDGGTSGSNCADWDGLIFVKGQTQHFRADNLKVYVRRCHGHQFLGAVYGVYDSSLVHLKDGKFGYYIHGGGYGGGGTCLNYDPVYCGDREWAEFSLFGSDQFLVLEDNEYRTDTTNPYMCDGWRGRRLVFRENDFYGTVCVDHGTDSTGRGRGARATEGYRNRFSTTDQLLSAVTGSRGGTALYWGNVLTENNGYVITKIADLSHLRDLNNPELPWECSYWHCSNDDGNLSATLYMGSYTTEKCAPWVPDPGCDASDLASKDWHVDQGSIGTVRANSFDTIGGYPALDQIGRGKGVLLSGDEYSGGVTPVGFPSQILDPVYCWMNTKSAVLTSCQANTFTTGFVTENVDFYNAVSASAQTSNSSPFDGTAGMGFGIFDRRPTQCVTGVAYWATDQGEWDSTNGNAADGKMYICTSPNTWEARYGSDGSNNTGTPLPYPHPLRN